MTDEGIPGEVVEVEVLKEKKNYTEAKTLKVLESSPHRKEPRCGHYKTCSPYQYIDYELQAMIKKEQVSEMLSHNLKLTGIDPVFRPSPDKWHYRNKIHLHIIRTATSANAAYHVPGTHDEFIRVTECFLVSETVNSLIKSVVEIISSGGIDFVEEIEIREKSTRDKILLIMYGNRKTDTDALRESFKPLGNAYPLCGIVYINRRRRQSHIVSGSDFLEENIDGLKFFIGARSFFQINIPALEILIKDMKKLAFPGEVKTLADFYCGVGTFGMLLASKVSHVIGVEPSGDNTFFLKKNILANNIKNFSIHKGTSEQWAGRILKEKIDLVILDPPRVGLTDTVARALSGKPVPHLAYISCNPSTLMRDLKILLGSYKLKHIYIYDFFPHTPHIETLAVLER